MNIHEYMLDGDFAYDSAKRLYSRFTSECHDAPIQQRDVSPKSNPLSRFAYFCTECNKGCEGHWVIVHRGD